MSDSVREQMLKLGLVSDAQASRRDTDRRQATGASQPRDDGNPAEQQMIQQIVNSSRLKLGDRPNRRFYVETRDAHIEYVEVPEAVLTRLERGQAAVVESTNGRLVVVDAEAASRILPIDATWVRAFNQTTA